MTEESTAHNNSGHDAEETKKCQHILAALSADEKEHAARSCYQYFHGSVVQNNISTEEETTAPVAKRDAAATRMARRHVRAEKGNQEKALKKMQASIAWRKNTGHMDDLRRCFYEHNNDNEDATTTTTTTTEEKQKLYSEMRTNINTAMEDGKIYLIGYDKSGRSIMSANMGKYIDFNNLNMLNFYMLERAIAATERNSKGTEEKIICVFDFNQYSYKNTMPLGVAKEFAQGLQNHFPERVERIILCDAPYLFRVFWKMIRVFVDPVTRSKVVLTVGNEEKEALLSNYIAKEQCTPFMSPHGEKTTPFDKKEFFYDIPFDHVFDE